MGKNDHLIIGNGFNLALKDLIGQRTDFNINLDYKSLINGIKNKLQNDSDQLKNFIDRAEEQHSIQDVEFLLYILEASEKFLPHEKGIYIKYEDNEYQLIQDDIKKLKQYFIRYKSLNILIVSH